MSISIRQFQQNRAKVPLHESIIKLVFNEASKNRLKKIPRIKIKVGGNIFELGQASHWKGESLVLQS